MIYEYLKERGAYGARKAVPGKEIMHHMECTARRFDAVLYAERKAGCLICNKSTVGYYLPACVEDVREFVRQQEGRIKKHAVTLKAARAFLKQQAAGRDVNS